MLLSTILTLTPFMPPAAAKVYTGFNYGAFWSHESNVKRYADFYHGFQLAKNLTDVPVPFDSARLFTCITTGTKDDPTEAFQAAIDTGTHLLLGMWVSPGATGLPNTAQIGSELTALGKGFEQHGEKLADLVIGLSIGSEDIYRFNAAQPGLSSDDLSRNIEIVRDMIAASKFADYMKGKPIGHADTASYSVVQGTDFAGMNAYPFWEGEHINGAAISFKSALEATKKRAGNTPVWITEMGWPINGTQTGEAVASPENYQKYWDEVGCQIFGRYTSFWFELLQDSTPEQPDWGLLDTKTYRPRIKDLSCGAKANTTASTIGKVTGVATASSVKTVPTTFSTIQVPASISTTIATSSAPSSVNSTLPFPPPAPLNEDIFTMYVTTTTSIPAQPSTPPNATISGPSKALTVCIAMMDMMGDGVFIPVATYAADIASCKPPPRFTGSPFTMVAGPLTASAGLANATASWDSQAPSSAISASTTGATLAGGLFSAAPPRNSPHIALLIFSEAMKGLDSSKTKSPVMASTSATPPPLPPPPETSFIATTTFRRSPGPAVPQEPQAQE